MNHIDFIPKQTQIESLIREKLPEILSLSQQEEIDQILDYSNSLNSEDKTRLHRNGWRKRSYTTLFGKVDTCKQRFRKYLYHPFKMPAYARRTTEFNDFIEFLYQSGLSTREIERLTKFLYAPISRSTVSRINKSYDESLEEVNYSSLAEKTYSLLFADAKYHSVRVDGTKKGHVEDRAIITLLGLNEETGRLELLYMGIHKSENYQTYKEIFESLSRRGLKETPMLGINDGQRGLTSAFTDVFPLAFDQICGFHRIKNRLDKLHKPEFAQFRELVVEAMMNKGTRREEALKALEAFSNIPFLDDRVKKVLTDLETSTLNPIFDLLDMHKLFTSNALERLNGDLEQRLSDMFALPNERALQRICVKRAQDYLSRRGEYLDPELLKLTRSCFKIFTESLTEVFNSTLADEKKLYNSDLSQIHSPLLAVDVEQMPFVFDGSILQLKFVVSRVQSPDCRIRKLIGIYPLFDHELDNYEKALENLLERNFNSDQLHLIQCSQDQGPLVEAIKRVFENTPVQIDVRTLRKNIMRELPEKYKEAFEKCFNTLAETPSLEEGQVLLDSLSLSLDYHSLYSAKKIFDDYAPDLLTIKKLGFKNPSHLLDCSEARVTKPTRKFKTLSNPIKSTRNILKKFKKASSRGKTPWLDQQDLDLLF